MLVYTLDGIFISSSKMAFMKDKVTQINVCDTKARMQNCLDNMITKQITLKHAQENDYRMPTGLISGWLFLFYISQVLDKKSIIFLW